MKLGDKFGMSMRLGIPYSMVSEVIDFEDNRCIAWQSCPPGLMGKMSGGRIWRYDLEPVGGGTRSVRRGTSHRRRARRCSCAAEKVHAHTRDAMEKTLENIEKLLASS